MKKINLKIILAIAILFYSAKSFSQTTTTTILYDASSNLSTTKCNVFDPPVNVGGLLHTGVIGGATFSTANGLDLPTSYTFSSSQMKRTDYRISYPFKSGYAYRIEFTAFGDVSNSTNYPSLGASLFTAAGLTLTSTSCGAVYNNSLPQLGSVLITQLNGTSTTYSPSSANFTSPYNYDYLVLEATCSAAQDITANVYIQKIKIIETAPISFTLPASTTFGCGSTTPQTFTVTNVYGTTGITNYTWNLGSASNNWLYNGTAAPQTISTGTTGSISLTPVCGKVQTNVNATVTANGNTYNTNTSSVSVTPPVMSINGSNAICSGSLSYYVNGLPCNSTVAWSASPAGIVSLSTVNNQATLTKTGAGVVTLTATVSNDCAPATLTERILVGSPSVTIAGPNSVCPCQCCNFFTDKDIPGATYTWSISPTTGNNLGPSGNQVEVIITSPSYLTVQVTTSCGTASATRHVFLTQPAQCHAGCSIAYTIAPNPAQNTITISLQNAQNNKTSETQTGYKVSGIKSVQVYDVSGHLIKQQQTSGNKIQQMKMNVSSLSNGTYSIVVSDGKIIETHEIIIQR